MSAKKKQFTRSEIIQGRVTKEEAEQINKYVWEHSPVTCSDIVRTAVLKFINQKHK